MNEAASLGVLDGADIVHVERVQAGLVRIGVDILLAFLPEAQLLPVIQASRFEGVGPNILALEAALRQRVVGVRQKVALRDGAAVNSLRGNSAWRSRADRVGAESEGRH
ncbi:hypothetical protein D9599_02525 [Roseomonas sp. KE2513]|uniref:hypothetical protein n=1 Tax=Roseomonas sp. KE2513 TaxID=2479202 RepID=UPI0018DF2774|nr:hypothetical protein [Roseomonas sp. KE2513]MBI0534443.1 hypothetical protein [Roseomonas sp. KE2513]